MPQAAVAQGRTVGFLDKYQRSGKGGTRSQPAKQHNKIQNGHQLAIK